MGTEKNHLNEVVIELSARCLNTGPEDRLQCNVFAELASWPEC